MKVCTEAKHVWKRGPLAVGCRCGKVKRCCACYGKVNRCRRRQAPGSAWCTKHAWIEAAIQAVHKAGGKG